MILTATANPTAQVLLSLVPVLGVVFGTVLLFFFLLWQYKLKKELIRKGQYEPSFGKNLRKLSLLTGSLSIMTGIPLTILLTVLEGISYSLLGGLIPLAAGAGLLLFAFLGDRMGR